MSDRPIFREDESSQIPALQLLQNMGWTYLTPEEALAQRKGNPRSVILEEILEERLRSPELNRILVGGEEYDFGNANIVNAIHEIKRIPFEGLQTTSEKVFELLTLGKSLTVNINGDRKSYNLKYIDWTDESNNVYHVTEEFIVESHTGNGSRKIPDLVLFINGIPIVVIECKRTDYKDPIEEAVSQQIRNQEASNIPNLFVFSQILMAVSPFNVREKNRFCLYATTGTPRVYWYPWIEDQQTEYLQKLELLVNKPLTTNQKARLFADRFRTVRPYFDKLEGAPRQVTDQDRMIYSLCGKERVLEVVKKFILFDGGTKKIARYQQYFTVKQSVNQICQAKPGENRKSGVVWHTQGSGKSLSMVMLAKALAMDSRIREPKIVLITDRIDLDDQIFKTFQNCGVSVRQASSGQDLIDSLRDSRAEIIATTIFKFDSLINAKIDPYTSHDIILLVDEAHRSQYGEANSKVHKVFPNACFIGYTGTPLTENERRDTMGKFGPVIGRPYTNRDALRDNAVVPLVYEGRMVPQDPSQDIIDRRFERMTAGLSDAQKAEFKMRYRRRDQLAKTDQRIYTIAADISEHFSRYFKSDTHPLGFKGLLAVDSIASAMKYRDFFKEIDEVDVEVVIAKTNDRSGHREVGEELTALQRYEEYIKNKWGDHKKFERDIKKRFDSEQGPDILIVVWKLLTGFDVQRTTVLYLDKNLDGHTLLQATARVNRTFPKKQEGYIIDYHGNLDNFIDAIKHYDDLAAKLSDGIPSEEMELKSAIDEIESRIKLLPQHYADLVGMFSGIKNKIDVKEYENAMWEPEKREEFYERLGLFGRTLHLALSSDEYYQKTAKEEVDRYKSELKFFNQLKYDLKMVFQERIDYRDYEPKIERILNDHVMARGIETVVEPISIYDLEFEKQLEGKDTTTQALTILNSTNKYISENVDRDRDFYERFSVLIQETLDDYRKGRLAERQLLAMAQNIKEKVRTRTGDDVPEDLQGNDSAKSIFGTLKRNLSDNGIKPEVLAHWAKDIDQIIVDNIVVDWVRNTSIQNNIKNLVEDYLLEVKSKYNMEINFETIDKILEELLRSAKQNRKK